MKASEPMHVVVQRPPHRVDCDSAFGAQTSFGGLNFCFRFPTRNLLTPTTPLSPCGYVLPCSLPALATVCITAHLQPRTTSSMSDRKGKRKLKEGFKKLKKTFTKDKEEIEIPCELRHFMCTFQTPLTLFS